MFFTLRLNRKVASCTVRSPEPEVSCILISCLPGCWAALLAVGDIALVCPGMILIREVADAPVIMGISKPADLKITTQGGEINESTFCWHRCEQQE